MLISPKKLIFQRGRIIKQQIKLSNTNTKIPVIYQFDSLQSIQSPFQLDKSSGTIKPNSSISITVTFSPTEKKVYINHLACLILNEAPIFIELYGYSGVSFNKDYQNSLEASISSNSNQFNRYFIDSNIRHNHQIPPLSISKSYFIFETNGSRSPKSQKISVTNHCKEDIFFQWNQISNNIFYIIPGFLTIHGNETNHFELFFNPNENNKWFKDDITAQTIWNNPHKNMFLSVIRVIGRHSNEEYKWLANQQTKKDTIKKWINNNDNLIILPTSAYDSFSYTTFIIKNNGFSQLLFKFKPPQINNENLFQFNVKPQVGLIEIKKFQIVVVEKLPLIQQNSVKQTSVEQKWLIEFDEGLKLDIIFRGLIDIPKIIFSNDNIIHFDSIIYPGCCDKKIIAIKNISKLSLRFVISEIPDFLKINEFYGIINANEIINLEWIFQPIKSGDYDFCILCTIYVVEQEGDSEKSIDMCVNVSGSCQYGSLEAEVNELNFGEILYNSTKKNTLKINKSLKNMLICFKLNSTCLENEITFSPSCCNFFKDDDSKEVVVLITPINVGVFRYAINCNLGKQTNPVIICWINYSCILPTMKIFDLEISNVILNKYILWKLLKINEWNSALGTLHQNEKKIIEITLPLTYFPLMLKIMFKNNSCLPVNCTIQQIQLNNKELVVSKFKLQKNEKTVINITINPEIWRIILNIDYKREIILKLKKIDSKIFLCKELIEFDEIYLGDLNPDHQVYWLYNQTENDISYYINSDVFENVNTYNHSKSSLICSNMSGVIPGKSFYPIFFKYYPRRSGVFPISIPLYLNNNIDKNENIKLKINLKSTLINNKIIDLFNKDICNISPLNFDPVELNPDFIVLSSMVCHGQVLKMIMLVNKSCQEVFGYQWKIFNIPDVIKIIVKPDSGIIQPKSLQTFRLIIDCGGKACKVNCHVCCELINLDEKRTYQRDKIIFHNDDSYKNYEEFLITEKGTFFKEMSKKNIKTPTTFNKVLCVSCVIVNEKKLPNDIRVKKFPSREIQLNNITDKIYISKNNFNTTKLVLENILW
ncbi:hypothetical protein HCN44_010261 [Aphidius gifuensis]|uniref:Hydrocephalus-inducing protein n=1 Tax=Aphidius gifuensis TaxID=684658 RepID=A0A834XX13_APHGI|nr:hypothetical protein HCN44_010261 [Aphidius gifuensis]